MEDLHYINRVKSLESTKAVDSIQGIKVKGLVPTRNLLTRHAETMYLAPDREIIERDEWRIAKVGLDVGFPENAQHLGRKYSAIPRSKITRVELKKGLFGKGVRLNIITSEKE